MARAYTSAQLGTLAHVALTGDRPPHGHLATWLALLELDGGIGFDVDRIERAEITIGDAGRATCWTGPYFLTGAAIEVAERQPAVRRARLLEARGFERVERPWEQQGRKRRRARVWYVRPADGEPIVQLCTRTGHATLWTRTNPRRCLGSFEADDDIGAALPALA